jgi:hypothetical protein
MLAAALGRSMGTALSAIVCAGAALPLAASPVMKKTL